MKKKVIGLAMLLVGLAVAGIELYVFFGMPFPEKEVHSLSWLPAHADLQDWKGFDEGGKRKVSLPLEELKKRALPDRTLIVVGYDGLDKISGKVDYWLHLGDDVYYYAREWLPEAKHNFAVKYKVWFDKDSGRFVYTPWYKELHTLLIGAFALIAGVVVGVGTIRSTR